MNMSHPVDVARLMIRRHGLKAQAVAMSRITEQRQYGDTAARHQWEQIHAAICELRRTAPPGAATAH